jgi:hypothetical protein
MQRLFSTFPNSWPGFGLLILRCALASSCIEIAMQTAATGSAPLLLASMTCGCLLIAGLWTPVVSLLLGLLLLWSEVIAPAPDPSPFILAAATVSLAMLGPGAWSLDAVLFGRKKIDLGPGGDA